MAKITAVDENAKVEDATVEETVTPVEDVVVEPEETIDSDFSVDNTEESYDEDVMPLPSGEEDATPVYNGDVAQQSSETIGKKWNEYTTGTDLDDTDELMMLDTSAKANKRTLLSKLSDYVLGKLADKVFAKLETQNKTVIGALNELNSKALSVKTIDCSGELMSDYPDSQVNKSIDTGLPVSEKVIPLHYITSERDGWTTVIWSYLKASKNYMVLFGEKASGVYSGTLYYIEIK